MPKINFNKYEPNEAFKIIREWTNLSQKEFGKSIGLSERSIQSYEENKRKISTDLLKKICKIHKIDITIEKK